MNVHKNARLTFARRIEMVQEMTERGMRLSTAAPLAGLRPCNRPIACHHRPYACLRGQIPRGAPLPRSGVPGSHPHLAQRASQDLCRASLPQR